MSQETCGRACQPREGLGAGRKIYVTLQTTKLSAGFKSCHYCTFFSSFVVLAISPASVLLTSRLAARFQFLLRTQTRPYLTYLNRFMDLGRNVPAPTH